MECAKLIRYCRTLFQKYGVALFKICSRNGVLLCHQQLAVCTVYLLGEYCRVLFWLGLWHVGNSGSKMCNSSSKHLNVSHM